MAGDDGWWLAQCLEHGGLRWQPLKWLRARPTNDTAVDAILHAVPLLHSNTAAILSVHARPQPRVHAGLHVTRVHDCQRTCLNH